MFDVNRNNFAAAIIAGGENSRMQGQDKCLLTFGQRSILELILNNLTPNVGTTIINANGDLSRFNEQKYPIISDCYATREGPLSGILACMIWLKQHHPEVTWLLTTASDTPFLPTDYVQKLIESRCEDYSIYITRYQHRDHYLNGLWHLSLVDALQSHFDAGERSIKRILPFFKVQTVDFSHLKHDPFFNINSPADYQTALAHFTDF